MSSAFIRSRWLRQVCLPALAFFLIALVPFLAQAQQDAAQKQRPRRALPSESEPQDVIKVDTDLVPIDVTVSDSQGRLVRNLKKEDFKLYEDGIERPIACFNVETLERAPRPVAIGFALCLSGSRTR